MNTGELTVVYIGGGGRTGSTLLLRILGTLDGYFPVGELTSIWRLYCQKNQMCGCGREFRQCEFWNAVMDEAFGGVDRVDAEGMVALRDSIRRHRLPMLVFPALRSHAYERRVSEYASILGTLYHAIQKVSGCNVVVDSSKAPYNALLVSEIPNVQASLIHLVRDSRAVAHSWQRRKRRAESPQQMVYMERYTPTQTAVSWSMSNVLTPIAARRFANHTVLRYEDLAAEPRQVLIDLARWLGADSSAFPFVSNDVVTLESDHALWGNPNRFETGPVRIRPDDEWRTTMNRRSRHVVTALTVPLLWKYGYLTRSQPDVVQPAAISPGP